MNIRNLLSKLVAQICENKFAQANNTLDQVVTEKVKARVKKIAGKDNGERLSRKQKEGLNKKNMKKGGCDCK